MVTYADAITLLLAFFVMIVTFSKFDMPLFEQVQAGLAQDIGKREVVRPITLLRAQMEQLVNSLGVEDTLEVTTDDDGVVLELAANALYRPGSAEIRPEARSTLENVATVILNPRYGRFFVTVEGHTDDTPIATDRYPTNWDLSAARAAGVVRLMLTAGVPDWRLKAVGHADTRPKAPNRDAVGNPIPENQAQNRRITVRLNSRH